MDDPGFRRDVRDRTMALLQPLHSFVSPIASVPRAVAARRWPVPLLLLMASVAFAGVGFALRWDAAPSVVHELSEGKPTEAKPTEPREQEVVEGTVRAQRMALVGAVATGLFAVPLAVLALAGLLKWASWLMGGQATYKGLFAALCIGLLPLALGHLILGVCELWQLGLTPERVAHLVPSNLGVLLHPHSAKLFRALASVDLFRLWSAGLLGLGISEAARLSRLRAMGLAFGAHAVYAAVVLVALPGLMGAHP